MGLMDLPPRSALLKESSDALLAENTVSSKHLIFDLDVCTDLSFSIPFLTLCQEEHLFLPLAKKPPNPAVQVLHLPMKEKRELAGCIHRQLGNAPCAPEQSLLEEPEVQK